MSEPSGPPAADPAQPAARPAPGRGLPLPGLPWRGFTLQFFLIGILPLTILLLVVAFGSQSLHHASMRALVGDRDLRAVRAAAAGLTHEIEHRQAVLAALAASAPELSTPEQAQAFLARPNLPLEGFEYGLAVIGPDGQVLASRAGTGGPEGVDLFGGGRTAPSAPPAGIQPGQVWFDPPRPLDASAPRTEHSSGPWVITLNAMAAPGSSQAEAPGSSQAEAPGSGQAASGARLVAGFDPSSLAANLLAPISGPGAATVVLLSADGSLLYLAGGFDHSLSPVEHPGAAEALRGEWGVNYMNTAGEHSAAHGEHVVAFAPVPPLGWGLVIEEAWEDIAGPLLSTTQSAPLVLAPLLVLAILALWFGARQIVQPLQALERRAAGLGRGDFEAIRAPVGGINEIQRLQDELVAMAQAVQAAQASLHGYIGALTAGVENERSTLARELHDDTLQALIALNQRVQLAALQTQDAGQQRSIRELQASVAATITNLRRAIAGLRPIYLEDLGLAAALGMLCRQAGEGAGFAVAFAITGEEGRLPPNVELAFYRIAQEALSNAAHHAQASQARVTLAFRRGGAALTVEDDGQGFDPPSDPNAFARQGHYGLLGMRERVELIGGTFKIESARGEGTRIVAEWAGG